MALRIEDAPHLGTGGVYLLFAHGKRPDRAALKRFVNTQDKVRIAHDPVDPDSVDRPTVQKPIAGHQPAVRDRPMDHYWAELLRDGLTFDLIGLADGSPCDLPKVEHLFDLESRPSKSSMEALYLGPGRHLSGGGATFPVAMGLLALARDLMHHFDELEAVVWPPAKSAIGRRYFESIVTAWLEGGPFPAIGLTAFRSAVDGALESVGLSFWIGQELRIEPPLSADKVPATRLAARIINQLVLIGGLEESERMIGPDGTRLIMRPSANHKFIRVSHE